MNLDFSISTKAQEDRVAEATDAYLEQLEQGQAPVIADFAARYPDIQDVLIRLLPALEVLRHATHTPNLLGDSTRPEFPLGDFEPIQEIGRGGMGIVYEARQRSLNRKVAIKILPFAATLDEIRIQRFRNESLAVASLDHPNIAEVYGVGCERGVHFYAMRLINGRSLAEILSSVRSMRSAETDTAGKDSSVNSTLAETITPSSFSDRGLDYFRTAAEATAQVAKALDHAHQQGIVHRDIKPANLMIDADGKPWVMDFGLAQINTGESLTMTGDLIGTLSYMSPEQVIGQPVDHRSDIYSLGATLYEMLTYQRLFAGKDKAALLRDIRETSPMAPSAVDPQIPRELETIVLKAISKEPLDRYKTAAELASDLTAWTEGRPILARPASQLGKGWRWCKRNPWIAALLCTIVLLSAAIAALSLYSRQKIAIQRDTILNERNQQAREREKAMGLIKSAVSDLVVDSLEVQGTYTNSQKQFLSEVVQLYDDYSQLLTKDSSQEHLQIARTFHDMGIALEPLGRLNAAKEALVKAKKNYKQSLQNTPSEEVKAHLIDCQISLAGITHTIGDWEEAGNELRSALEEIETLKLDDPQIRRKKKLEALISLGSRAEDRGDWNEAIKFLNQAHEFCIRFITEPTDESYLLYMAKIHYQKGLTRKHANEKDAAVVEYRKSIDWAEKITEPDLSIRKSRTLINATSQLAVVLRKQVDYKGSEKWHRRALELSREQTQKRPGNHDDLSRHSVTLNNFSILLLKSKQFGEAKTILAELIATDEKLLEATPEDQHRATGNAASFANMGKLNQYEGNYETAITWFNKAIAAVTEVLEQNPDSQLARHFLRNGTWSKAATLDMMGRHEEARKQWALAREYDTRDQPDIIVAQALNRAYLGDIEVALKVANQRMSNDEQDREALFDLARIFGLAAKESNETEKTKLVQKSLDALRKAIENQFHESNMILDEEIFKGLIPVEDLEAVVAKIE